MPWQQQFGVALASGVLIPVVLGLARLVWNRRRVPTALVRSVRRQSYLGVVLTESLPARVTGLDVLAPRLASASSSPQIEQIQRSWAAIAGRGSVRVVTLDSEECMKAGAELLISGIDVRIARRELGSENLSYHLFGTGDDVRSTAIVNHHHDGLDRPVRLNGTVPTQVFRDHFGTVWQSAAPLDSILAERIIERAGETAAPRAVLRALQETSASLNLDPKCDDRLLPHLAFRHGCPVVLLTGLPGSGKSYVRARLAAKLAGLSIKTRSITDYVYAYRDFVHEVIKLKPSPDPGFEAHPGGGFVATTEAALAPALRALSQTARDSLNDNEVTLVEFARANLIDALQEFDHVRVRAHVIYVSAPAELRTDRLSRRAEPPVSALDDNSITIQLSDNHMLPSAAVRTLYGADDVAKLLASREWRQRVYQFENNFDDGSARVDAALDTFIQAILEPYRTGEPQTRTAFPY